MGAAFLERSAETIILRDPAIHHTRASRDGPQKIVAIRVRFQQGKTFARHSSDVKPP
jgi:hypothetical protein